MPTIADGMPPEEIEELNQIKVFLSELPFKIFSFCLDIVLAILILFIGFKLVKLIRKIINKAMKKRNVDGAVTSFVDTSVNVALKILVVTGAALIMGVQAASVTALVGACGIAVSLAVQGSLSNFAGGVLILLLKPFAVGDYITDTASGQEGIVRSITIFYTKIQNIYGDIIVLPNGNLANTTIINKTNGSDNRNIRVEFSIAYNEDIETARNVVSSALQNKSRFINEDTKVFVSVLKLDDSGILLEAKAAVNKENYFEARTEALEIIKYALDDANISIPFPQLDVHFDKNVSEEIL